MGNLCLTKTNKQILRELNEINENNINTEKINKLIEKNGIYDNIKQINNNNNKTKNTINCENTHDNGVITSVHINIKHLKNNLNNLNIINFSESKKEFIDEVIIYYNKQIDNCNCDCDYLLLKNKKELTISSLTEDKEFIIKKLNYVIDNFEKDFDNIDINYNISLQDIFTIVWNNIRNENNEDKKNMLIINLKNEILDMFLTEPNKSLSNAYLICSTGKIGRLINVYVGLDDKIKIMSTNIIREEMLNKCIILREEFINIYNKYNNNYNDNELREFIRKKLYKEYVDNGIIDKKQFYEETTWIDNI